MNKYGNILELAPCGIADGNPFSKDFFFFFFKHFAASAVSVTIELKAENKYSEKRDMTKSQQAESQWTKTIVEEGQYFTGQNLSEQHGIVLSENM